MGWPIGRQACPMKGAGKLSLDVVSVEAQQDGQVVERQGRAGCKKELRPGDVGKHNCFGLTRRPVRRAW
ncbi:hypothetical protein K3G39_19225 [Pontibacter sp. HSC-14F20]|uniref:hypothetical protein n=1 Tax=Pontibacter sp. HSC-14F20 TaxID=2864136 RepID=UPI001C7387C3|nr:hypothetical protein [Pontibacter sp. HSC-14F20]MBX0335373.1 hypothetical protein [Pontibacter sp. HSC-14F20]